MGPAALRALIEPCDDETLDLGMRQRGLTHLIRFVVKLFDLRSIAFDSGARTLAGLAFDCGSHREAQVRRKPFDPILELDEKLRRRSGARPTLGGYAAQTLDLFAQRGGFGLQSFGARSRRAGFELTERAMEPGLGDLNLGQRGGRERAQIVGYLRQRIQFRARE